MTGAGLYALSDHQVMQDLLPGIARQQIGTDQARELLARHPGLVPIAIHPGERPGDAQSIYFADIGSAPFVEWKHIYTIQRLAEQGRIERFFATDLALLDQPLPVADGLQPDGLLLHVSRCGSTLFCKALARLESNMIINQGGPLQSGFWAALTDHWQQPLVASEENLTRLRRLVHLLTRRRGGNFERCFVKFISWNSVYADFIRAAFPDTPTLYLYRDPAEVLATVLQETTAALHARGTPLARTLTGLADATTTAMDDIEFLAHCYARYYAVVAEGAEELSLGLVNYRQMRQPECFAAVLERGLGWQPGDADLDRMREQFSYYSKDDSNSTRYQGEPDLASSLGPGGRERVEAIAGAQFRTLNRSPQNLFGQQAVDEPASTSRS
ncbi:MAG: hypothetical protein RQ741_10210 [Wenzhouxiangellaceae bacterium]|nr:hypothetical protein [Wenzhouxiangellaceae bacterium]